MSAYCDSFGYIFCHSRRCFGVSLGPFAVRTCAAVVSVIERMLVNIITNCVIFVGIYAWVPKPCFAAVITWVMPSWISNRLCRCYCDCFVTFLVWFTHVWVCCVGLAAGFSVGLGFGVGFCVGLGDGLSGFEVCDESLLDDSVLDDSWGSFFDELFSDEDELCTCDELLVLLLAAGLVSFGFLLSVVPSVLPTVLSDACVLSVTDCVGVFTVIVPSSPQPVANTLQMTAQRTIGMIDLCFI